MNVFRQLEPATRRNLVVLFLAGLMFWASLGSLLPTLSLYIKHVGATKHQVGIVIGAFAIGLVLFRPWMGWLADHRSRKLVLLIGIAVVAIAPLGYLMTQSIPLLMAIRVFHGLSIAAFTTAYSTLVVDLSPAGKRGELLGYLSLVNPIGVAIGPALGGFLQAWAGYPPLFLLSFGLGLLGFICALWVSPVSVNAPSARAAQPTTESAWKLLNSPRLRIPTLIMLLIGLAFGTLSTFVPLYIQEAGVDLNPGLFYTAAALASFGIRLPTGSASDRYGRGRFITFGLLLYTVAMVLLWLAHTKEAFLLAGVLEGAGSGMFIPVMLALMSDRSHADERGRVFGWCMMGFDLGIAIAGPTLGYFAEQIGYRGMFGLAGGLACLALLIFVSQSSKNLVYSLKFSLGHGRDLYALPLGNDL